VDYLRKRGLTDKTIRELRIGYDGSAFTFPVIDAEGRIVQLVRRPWPVVPVSRNGKEIRYPVATGHDACLYSQPLPEDSWILVAGMFDATVGRQEGLPVVTSICGQSFRKEWLPLVEDRRIYVMYDRGEYVASVSRAAKLREAGADAYAIKMKPLLKGKGKDLNDFFVNGGTAEQVTAHIKRERGAQRRRRAGK
jgi:hypothetical protein